MSLSNLDRTYWAVLILAPLGYALLNLEAFKRTGKRYLLGILVLDLTLFATTSLMFLIRDSDLIRGNVNQIREAMLIIAILRVPLHMFFYSTLLKDLPAQPAEGDD